MAELTANEKAAVEAFERLGCKQAAAKELGKGRSTIRNQLASAAKKGWGHGESNAQENTPEGFQVTGTSTQKRDELGNIVWVKTTREMSAVTEAISGLLDALGDLKLPKVKKTKAPKVTHDDLLNQYTITDFHLGMRAWARETGESWDTMHAFDTLIDRLGQMITQSPKAACGLLAILGDFLHWDGLDAVTPANKHILDADSRYYKIAELSLKVIIAVVQMMSQHHEECRVVIVEGNHDPSGSVWLPVALAQIFADNERVIIDDTVMPYYATLWGDNLLGFHHAHLKRMDDLPALFAAEPRYRPMWGKAKRTYIHTGHKHSRDVIEKSGAIVEQHPTLASRDSYSTRHGYVSERGAHAITYHKRDGEVSRITVRP